MTRMFTFVATLLVSTLLLGFVGNGASNVIGIDLNSDTVKVAIVQPGQALEIVTNFQSKRKTPVAITFYKGERMFGSDSTALMARKPELSFAKLYRTIGRTVEHPHIQELTKQYFPYDIYANETTTATTFKVEEAFYNSEELVAMMLSHVKEMTASFGGKMIKDCVITVPSSFTQHEREAVYTAAEIADLNVLTLIEENTAAALHYGIDRVFEEPQTVVFYNLGAGSVQVTIATYSSYVVKEAGKNKTIGQFEVIGKAWDSSVGGFNFDIKLAELLADRFNEAWGKKKSGVGKDLKDFVRPMTRLRIEATKVKEILSANQEYPVRSEQLHADTDLHTKVSRAQFEEACKDLFARLTDPIDAALAMANITLSDVHAVELLGGGVRMPKVKATLSEYFKAKDTTLEVGQHMNGDESQALGAAFRAANLSTAFRVRKVGIADVSTFGVSVRLDTLPDEEDEMKGGGGLFRSLLGKKKIEKKEGEEEEWSKFTSLYPAKSSVPSKLKTVQFQYDKDILCKVEYDEAADALKLPEGTSSLLAVYNITGISAFSKEAVEKGAVGIPRVQLSFGLDSSGIVSLISATATAEMPVVEEKEEEKKEAEGEVEEKKERETEEKKEGEEGEKKEGEEGEKKEGEKKEGEEGEKKEEDKKATKEDKKFKKAKKEAKKEKDNSLKKTLTVKLNRALKTPVAWSPAMIAESRIKLKTLQDVDDDRKAREASMNELEGFIYKAKNTLGDDEEKLKAVSTEEQRQEVIDMANEAEEWLYDDGRSATVAAYKDKQAGIATKFNAILKRFSEVGARAEKVKSFRKYVADVKNAVAGWAEKKPYITEEEKDEVLVHTASAEKWLEETLEAQDAKSPFEEPAFESVDVPRQLKVLALQFDKVSKKPKPLPPKVEKNETNTTETDGNATETVTVEVEEEVGEGESTAEAGEGEGEGDSSDSPSEEPEL